MAAIHIGVNAHLYDSTEMIGSAAGSGRVYPVLTLRGSGYPSVTIFPTDMSQLVRLANTALDALVDMIRQGAEVDGETGEALAMLAARSYALSYDEEAEAQAREAANEEVQA